MSERLQKVLAHHGLGSRREVERWIAAGRVSINRQVATLGALYHDGDRIAIDGREVTARLRSAAPQVLMFHKPQGLPIEHDANAEPADGERETVMERLPVERGSRWVPINPMHAGDSGLLLLTNDGKLSYALTRRKRTIPTAYMVRVLAPNSEVPPELPPYVDYDSERIEFSKVVPAGGEGANIWYRVALARADRRAAVRALFESHGLKVSRMTQVAFGDLELPRDLPRSRHRLLDADRTAELYELAGLNPPVEQKPVRTEIRKPKRRPPPDRRRAPKNRGAKRAR